MNVKETTSTLKTSHSILHHTMLKGMLIDMHPQIATSTTAVRRVSVVNWVLKTSGLHQKILSETSFLWAVISPFQPIIKLVHGTGHFRTTQHNTHVTYQQDLLQCLHDSMSEHKGSNGDGMVLWSHMLGFDCSVQLLVWSDMYCHKSI